MKPIASIEMASFSLPTPGDGRDDTAEGFPRREIAPATDFSMRGYDRGVIDTVWNNAEPVPGNDAGLWRKDEFGAWICRLDYGRRESEFGWEICDLSAGRADGGLAALRPMQWQNYLDQVAALTRSRMTADGLRNTRRLL
ncbi:MAG: hypothetical protein KDM91_07535 [Verrucomicrobiae bacterium]|nr:hypothetical protein [Verrucomicrobiae bacterium]MCP5539230.1 hypothetical protein [Akkermansiaceae bacterium]